MIAQHVRRPIPLRPTIAFLVLAALVLTIGYLYYKGETAQYRLQVGRELDALASLKVAQINRWRNECLADAGSLSQNSEIAVLLDRLMKEGPNQRLSGQLVALLEPIRDHHDYAALFFVDRSGSVCLAIGDSSSLSATCAHGLDAERDQRERGFVPTLHRDEHGDKLHVDIVAPIFKGEGQRTAFLGELVLQADPYLDLYPLVQPWPAPDKTSECLIVESVGQNILLLNEPRVQQEGAQVLLSLNRSMPLVEERAARGEEGIVSGQDYRGGEVLASIRKVPGTNWYLVTKASAEIITMPLKIRVWLAVLLTLALLTGAGAALVHLWRRKLLGSEGSVLEAAQKPESFMHQYDTLMQYLNDIVLLITLDGTIVSANDRAAGAYGYSREELVGMNIRHIRAPEKVKEVEGHMKQVAERGGMRFETVHRRKNGETFPVETSSRIIEIGGQKYFQAVVRDITERKKGEERLTKLNSCFLRFGSDPAGNINALVELCGELMGATCALYNRLDGALLCSIGQWNTPEDYQAVDTPEGRLCYDVIKGGREEILVVRNLPETVYFTSDPNVKKYDLRTYVGKGVRFGQENIGSLCAVFQADYTPTADDEKLMGIIASAIGVEEGRQRKEQALRESEERYRRLVEFSPDAIAVHINGRFVFVNPAGLRMMRAKELKDLVGKPILDIVHPDYLELVRARVVQQSEQPFVAERFVRFDGSAVDVEVAAIPITYEGKPATLVVARDVEERKRVEDALRKSEASYRGLFNSVSDAIYIQDKDGKFLDVNQGAVEMYGYPRDFFIGKTPAELAAPGMNDLQKTLEAVRKTFAGEPQRFEWWGRRENGEIFPKEVRLNRSIYFGQEVVVALAQDITERKEAEEAMRRLDLRFRRVWESSMDGMRILDQRGNFVMVNDAFCRLVGKTEDELVGKPFTAAYVSRSVTQDEENIKIYRHHFATRGFARHQELELPLQGSKRIPVELSNSLLEIPNEPPLLLSIFRDTTERREAEQKLRESEEKFRTLSEQSPNMIYINKGGKVVYANQRCVELMGYSKEEFYAPTFNFLSLIAPEHVAFVKKSYARHLTGEEILPYEYVLLTKDRRRIVGLHTTRLINYEGETAILGIITDVTETRHTEEELRKLHQAVEQSPSSIVITDTAGTIEYVNPKFTEITGYSLEEAVGKNPRILKSGHTSPEEYAMLWETIKSGKEWRGEFRNKKKNGELFWEQASISPIRDATGNITHFLAVKEDITKRKLLEQQLWQAQKMESIGTLASGIAHDFNNILGIILGYASLLGQKSITSEKTAAYLDAILKATDRGAGLVRQILTFARKGEFRLEKVNVNSLIGELAKMLGETFPKTITLSLQLEKALPLLSIDRTQLHQALLNLCVNARDAMADRGSLSITTRLVAGDSLGARFAAAFGRMFVEIGVSDTGVGIDETTKGRIFEPFFTTKEIGKGTGLGLAVVFGVVQEHQGFVDVESEMGRGSTFLVYLPVPEGVLNSTNDAKAKSIEIPGGSETILVVEDEELMLELVVTLLVQKGYYVLKAKDGEEAVKLHARHKDQIDLVLSDIGLPKLDGREACRRMKQIDPELVVFLASGYLDPSLRSEILKGGVSGFIDKPYSPSEIIRKVREALDSR